MARKVKIQDILIPVGISYGAGIMLVSLIELLASSLGEKFWLYKPGNLDVNKNPILSQLTLSEMLQTSLVVLVLAFMVTNISLFLGRSRIYVLVLGFTMFASMAVNPYVSTTNWNTCLWLELIHIGLAAPIFYVIYKFIPKQNKI
jgi:hypothetical protein